MKTPEVDSCDVLIVGAGPTGMLLGSLLVQHGLRVRIIESEDGPARASRAQLLQPRTLEIFEQRGIVERFLARGQPLQTLGIYGQHAQPLFQIGVGEEGTRYPFLLALPQREIEELLGEHLAVLDIPIERRSRLVSLRQDDHLVETSVQRSGQKEVETIRSAWLVGCDGANSTVRAALGMSFQEPRYAQRVIQADVRIDWPLRHPPDELLCFLSEEGALIAFPQPSANRYCLFAFEDARAATLKNLQQLLDSRGPKGSRISDPAWMGEYPIQCGRVANFHAGRVFLVGDAAHRLSPATGQGMNCGMQDAANLAWKLALVHQGKGRPSLLDSYTAERSPVADALLNVANPAGDQVQELAKLCAALAPGLRDYALRFITSLGLAQHRVSRRLAMLDVGYRRSAIVDQHRKHPPVPAHEVQGSAAQRDWPDFDQGPGPGERAIDGPIALVGEASRQGLFELLGAAVHILLLFSGIAGSPAGRDRLIELGQWVSSAYPGTLKTYLVQVSPGSIASSVAQGIGGLLIDQGGHLHRTYGAHDECLYLIRPDGYIGYRSRPVDQQRLAGYLSHIFT